MHLKYGCDLQLGRSGMRKQRRRRGHHPCLCPVAFAGGPLPTDIYIPSQEWGKESHDPDRGHQVLRGMLRLQDFRQRAQNGHNPGKAHWQQLQLNPCLWKVQPWNLLKDCIKFTHLIEFFTMRTPTDTFSSWKSWDPVKLEVTNWPQWLSFALQGFFLITNTIFSSYNASSQQTPLKCSSNNATWLCGGSVIFKVVFP